jgi:hypothetical protein
MTTSEKREAVQNMFTAVLQDLQSRMSFAYCYSKLSGALKYSTNAVLRSSKGVTSIITNEENDRLHAAQP